MESHSHNYHVFSSKTVKSNFCLLPDCQIDESLWRGIELSYRTCTHAPKLTALKAFSSFKDVNIRPW